MERTLHIRIQEMARIRPSRIALEIKQLLEHQSHESLFL
jgi:hypothetical protein